jgi:hypothetical protein
MTNHFDKDRYSRVALQMLGLAAVALMAVALLAQT